jgi:hypothetical protein
MRTLGGEVVGGRWGRSLVGGSLSEAFWAARVAVFLCCLALDLLIMRRHPEPRIKSMTFAGTSIRKCPPRSSGWTTAPSANASARDGRTATLRG